MTSCHYGTPPHVGLVTDKPRKRTHISAIGLPTFRSQSPLVGVALLSALPRFRRRGGPDCRWRREELAANEKASAPGAGLSGISDNSGSGRSRYAFRRRISPAPIIPIRPAASKVIVAGSGTTEAPVRLRVEVLCTRSWMSPHP